MSKEDIKKVEIITILPTTKELNRKNIATLIRESIKFEIKHFNFKGIIDLGMNNLLVDKVNNKAIIFDSEQHPLIDNYVVGMCDYEDYILYETKGEYREGKTVDDLFNDYHFDTYNELLSFIVSYVFKLIETMKILED